MSNTTINITPAVAVITPYAHGLMADNSHKASVNFDSGSSTKPLLNYYLYCVAVELSFKAAILSKDCTDENKKVLKNIGHNLLKALDKCEESFDLSFLDQSDREVIEKINPFFKNKALEYFTGEMMLSMLTGHKDLPKITDMKRVSEKINKFLNDNELFKDGSTSYEPVGGWIHFI